jgi:hypothetical protein
MRIFMFLLGSCVLAQPVLAQDIPAGYVAVLKTLTRQGDYKDGVLRVNVPRNDLNASIDGVATPTPFGFGGWIALTKGDHGDVMMGDLVLREEEVNPVMSAVLDNGLDVTALHNHFFYETPRIFYMHVHGHGLTPDIVERIAPALALIGKTAARRSGPAAPGKPIAGTLDSGRLRSHEIEVLAIHHHMTGTEPTVYFLHYWGRGAADTLAGGVRAAGDWTGPGPSARR